MFQHRYIAFFIFIVALSFSPTPCGTVDYYVTPTSSPNTNCPQPCYTLDYYALNPALLSSKENVSLLFLDGLHTLNKNLNISQTRQISLTKVNSSTDINIIVKCNRNIRFEDIDRIEISNVTILGKAELREYGAVPTTSLTYTAHTALLQHLILDGSVLELSGNSTFKNCELNYCTVSICSSQKPNMWSWSSLTLYKSKTIDTTIESQFLCKDLKLSIIGCTVERDRGRIFSYDRETVLLSVGPSANLSVEIVDSCVDGDLSLLSEQENNNISVYIHHTEIRNSNDLHDTLTINLGYNAINNNLQVQITDSKISDGQKHGLNVLVDVTFGNTIDLSLSNTSLSNHYRGAIRVLTLHFLAMEYIAFESETVMNIAIKNCTFTNNTVAVAIIELKLRISLKIEVLIIDSNFSENESALDFRRKSLLNLNQQTTVTRRLFVSLRNVTMENNSPRLFESGIIRLYYVDMLTLEDCRIINNLGSAIESYFSGVTLAGDTLFSNNTSIKGGALLLYDSYFYLTVFSNISFFNNHAHDVGGAIHLKQRPHIQSIHNDFPPCFYQIKSIIDILNPELNLNFKSNLASNGGDDIYGGSLYAQCELFNSEFHFDTDFVDELFHFQNKTLSSVTSDPTRVCLCDDQGNPQCANMDYIYRELPPRYPGEVFTIPAVVVGYDLGTVLGVVHSECLGNDGNSSIGQNQRVQEIKNHRQCTQLKFFVESLQMDTVLTIQLNVSRNAKIKDKYNLDSDIEDYKNDKIVNKGLLNQAVQIRLLLEHCPIGFTLTTTPPYICTCHPTLVDNGVTVCIITNHTGWLYRSGTVWVSDSFSGNETHSFVVHLYCPYDYCKPENISVDLKFPDTQCAFNHSGVLCGGCVGNLSLALGTSKCLLCNNHYVSLLIVFIFAGLALVFFIKVLDLTVAKGTINGVILYANIVWANKSILFPTTETLHPVQQILRTFIAWLNLDLGIETCFIDGLSAYWKTWLQFVFPLYVWSITGVVIIASHYSTRASKIFGNNSVPVLATLILLSYTKLLHTIIASLGFSLLEYPEGTRVVWSFDGNVPYFGAAHTILFLVALAALLLLWLPYTTVLLTLQWLRRKAYLKPLRWINRWKPFFDAYFGQLKPKHYYWVGLLLLVRVILLVLFASISAVLPKLNIISMAITGHVLLVKQIYTGSMYKSLHLSILENSFIVNLTVLGVAKLYMLPNDPGHTPVIYTSIGVVFIEFLAIVIYHIWCRLKSTYLTYKRRHTEEESTPPDREMRPVAAVPHDQMHYREPLLDSSVED